MPKQGVKESYTSISIPKSIMSIVDEVVNGNPFYRSQAEYVRCAIREKIENDRKPNLR